MKADRRLRLRREVTTSLDPDLLRGVTGQGTISKGPGECVLERLLRPSVVALRCSPTVDVNTCPTLPLLC